MLKAFPFSCRTLTCSLLSFLVSSLAADPIDLSVGTAAQSSQLDDFEAGLAIDGISNFTHTLDSDPNLNTPEPSPTAESEFRLSPSPPLVRTPASF